MCRGDLESLMSRTIAHTPAWVRLNDPRLRIEVHDHRHGGCDLPDTAAWTSDPCATRCRWALDVHAAGPTCGCALCTDAPWRRAERRRDRRRSRQLLRHADWHDI